MGSVLISVEELEKASNAFVDDFSFGKMDHKIHRFPAELRAVGERYIVPMVVAIGPYHRGSQLLQGMEQVKRAAAFHFIKGWEDTTPLKKVHEAVLSVAGNARKLYAGDAAVGMGNHDFAAMMLIDACFLLQYMDAYPFFESTKDFVGDESLRRFLFTNRACINNDIMLLENQLPWLVVRTIINSLSHAKDYMHVVNNFIADMGNAFKIDQVVNSVASNNKGWTPPRLLGLVRRHKMERGTSPEVDRISASSATSVVSNTQDGKKTDSTSSVVLGWMLPCLKIDEETNAQDSTQDGKKTDITEEPHLLGLLRRHKTEPGTDVNWPEIHRISASSAIELAEIGIKLKASKPPDLFTDMDVRKRGPFCGDLSLAPLSLNDTRACWLVNMAAFEVSTASTFREEHGAAVPNKTAVCSYLALLSMFMLREEDVRELRSKRILHGHHTNAEMLAFFKNVTKLLPDTGCRFAHIMACIEDYKKNRWLRTKVHRFVYNNFTNIIKLVTIIGTLVGIFQALLSVNQA